MVDTPRQLNGVVYVDFLAHLHHHLSPTSYLEVGTEVGESLRRSVCDAIAVDPQFDLAPGVMGGRRRLFLFQMPSDTFFREHDVRAYFPRGFDMAFLDGMHRVEYLLRDFINAEAVSHRRSLILLHDCLPTNDRMAQRVRVAGGPEEGDRANDWTGDVWKILPILKQYRPELRVHVFDCPPTGLVAVSGLDRESTVLRDNYDEILDSFGALSLKEFGIPALWSEFPLLESRQFHDNPDQLTLLLSVY